MHATHRWLAVGLLVASMLVGCKAPGGIDIGGPADCRDRCQLYVSGLIPTDA